MSAWMAWLVIAAIFGIPIFLLWLWRDDPSKPEARQDLEDAYEHLRRQRPELDRHVNIDRWRGMGTPR
jgi:hypothetical protein